MPPEPREFPLQPEVLVERQHQENHPGVKAKREGMQEDIGVHRSGCRGSHDAEKTRESKAADRPFTRLEASFREIGKSHHPHENQPAGGDTPMSETQDTAEASVITSKRWPARPRRRVGATPSKVHRSSSTASGRDG